MRNRLVLQGITQTFEDGGSKRTILDKLDLEVAEGELVAVMGPSGSGKSTFLSIAGALLEPTEGQVLLDGASIMGKSKQDISDVRLQQLGFIFQSANLIPYLKVEEQLMVVAKLAGTDKNKAEKRVDEPVGYGRVDPSAEGVCGEAVWRRTSAGRYCTSLDERSGCSTRG